MLITENEGGHRLPRLLVETGVWVNPPKPLSHVAPGRFSLIDFVHFLFLVVQCFNGLWSTLEKPVSMKDFHSKVFDRTRKLLVDFFDVEDGLPITSKGPNSSCSFNWKERKRSRLISSLLSVQNILTRTIVDTWVRLQWWLHITLKRVAEEIPSPSHPGREWWERTYGGDTNSLGTNLKRQGEGGWIGTTTGSQPDRIYRGQDPSERVVKGLLHNSVVTWPVRQNKVVSWESSGFGAQGRRVRVEIGHLPI